MTPNEILFRVVEVLEQAGVEYMLVGSFSSNAYGIPRSTRDADFVVELGSVNASAISSLLKPDLLLDPQMQLEMVTGTFRYIVTHPHDEFMVELFLLTDDPHNRERFRRRRRAQIQGRSIWIPTAEDVVIQKLRWYARARRTKDLDDARDVLAVQKPAMDLAYIRNWCDQHGTTPILEDLMKQVESI